MQNTTPPALGIANSGVTSQEASSERALAPPTLLHYWQVSLRWKCLIRGITAAALPIGLVATLLATPQYTATSGIEISSAQKNVTNVESLESAEAGRNLEFYQTQYSLMVRNLINAAFSKYIQYGTKSLK